MRMLALFFSLLLIAACQAPVTEMTTEELAQYEAEVREEIASQLDLYKDALLRGDPEGFMSIYTSDARTYEPGMNFTRYELEDWVVEAFQTITWTGFEAKPVELFVYGDTAYTIYVVSIAYQMEGEGPVSETSNCFTRWEKEGGVWKVDRDMCGPRDAPAEG